MKALRRLLAEAPCLEEEGACQAEVQACLGVEVEKNGRSSSSVSSSVLSRMGGSEQGVSAAE